MKIRTYLVALSALAFGSAMRADEGMWLLQLMKQQNSIELMKKQGLKLEADDLYNPNGVSLKDAVGIFGGGCTGEIISPEGLIHQLVLHEVHIRSHMTEEAMIPLAEIV